MFLLLSLGFTIFSSLGLLNFYEESDMTALWVPKGSKLRNNVEWVQKNFPQQLRYNQVIFKADNVLTPETFQEMYNLTVRMREVIHHNKTWQDVCFRVPVVTKPKCFDPSQLNLLAVLGKKKKRNVSVEKENDCSDLKMPTLSFNEITSLLPVLDKIKTKGFSTELGDVFIFDFCKYL